MSFLCAESRAALEPLEHLVNQEISKSRSDKKIETARFRQAVYIKWCLGILRGDEDTCGNGSGYQYLVSCFIKNLIISENCRSATARGYLEAINELFTCRHFEIPANLSNPENYSAKLIDNWQREEDIARQRNPITAEILAWLIKEAKKAPPDSEIVVVAEWFCLIKIIGCRGCEYAQNTQTKVEVHVYPSGKRVTKAFIRKDWIFYDSKGRRITKHGIHMLKHLGKLKVTWRIQKNRRNGQSISIVAEYLNIDISAVHAAYKIFLRSIRLGQKEDEPMGIFVNKGEKRYLTTNKIAQVLQKAARAAHPTWTEDEVKRISSHSGRVWALVLLSEAGESPDFMKKRLRWEGESYRLYLRDTAAIQDRHRKAVDKASAEVLRLLGQNLAATPTDTPEEANVGNYISF